LISSLSFQSCQEATAPENEATVSFQKISNHELSQNEYVELIKKTAHGLAIFLKSEHNRKLLKNELNKSQYVEKILEASEFLNKTYNLEIDNKIYQKTMVEGIATNIKDNQKENYIAKISNLKFGMIDIYFPLEKWRKEWDGSNNLLVAAVGYRKNDDKSDILAYDLDGNEVYLPANEIPKIPTLVVYPSEKRGNYTLTHTGNYYKILQKFNSIASTNNEGGNDPTTEFRSVGLYIEKDYDSGWFGGDMEIIFKVWKRPIGGNWGSPFFVYIDPDVVAGEEGGQWKSENKQICTNIGTNYEIAIQALEDDGWLNGWYDLIHDTQWSKLRRPDNVLLATNIVPIWFTVSIGYVFDPAPNDDVRLDLRCNYLN